MQTFQHNQQKGMEDLTLLNSSNKKQYFPRHLYHSLLYGEGENILINIRQLLKYQLYSMFSIQFECMHSQSIYTHEYGGRSSVYDCQSEPLIHTSLRNHKVRNSYQNTSIRMPKILNSDNRKCR